MLISKEEAPRTFYSAVTNNYYMHYEKLSHTPYSNCGTKIGEFTSDLNVVSKEELQHLLQTSNYFKPV